MNGPKLGPKPTLDSTTCLVEFVPPKPQDVSDLALLPQHFRMFAAEIRQSFDILNGKVLPLLAELRDVVRDHTAQLNDHNKRISYLEGVKSVHAEVLIRLEAKDAEHAQTVTGVFKRLIVLEETVAIQQSPVRKLKKRKVRSK